MNPYNPDPTTRYPPYQNPHQPMPPQPPPNYTPPPTPPQEKWYKTNAGIILMLFLFFPVGLFLMWRYAVWAKQAKWVVTGILAFFVVVSSIANATTATTTPQVQQPTPESKPTEKPKPTEAPKPTPKPLTPKERILAIVSEHKGTDSNYDEGTKSLDTTIILGAQWSAGTMKDSVKMECYDMQKALWTANPPLDLESVVVFVHGDVVDRYGNESKEQVGACTLKKPTAEKFNWQNLTWRTAWDAYDFKSLAPFLQNA